jgi:hypothetical protein
MEMLTKSTAISKVKDLSATVNSDRIMGRQPHSLRFKDRQPIPRHLFQTTSE